MSAAADAFALAADILDPQPLHEWEPFPKQALAEELSYRADELLFGGAAGPGKSEWLIEHCIGEMRRYPGNRGLILRRVYPSLRRTIIPRLHAKLAGYARWNGVEHAWTFPNGSVLELGHAQYAHSVHDYQGAEYGVVAFEEVTEFLQSQYEYFLQRLRPPNLTLGIRPHIVSTTNPGNIGHAWVKRRFVKPEPVDIEPGETAQPYRPWRPASTSANPDPGVRCFVPATMDDNPALMTRDPGYRGRVMSISNVGLRLALSLGDWDAIDAVEGALWKREWLDGGRVLEAPDTVIRRLVALDPSDGTEAKVGDEFGVWAGCLGADRTVYTEHSDGWILDPGEMAQRAVTLAREIEADGIVVEKNHGGAWVKATLLQVDRYVNVITTWASKGKVARAEPVASLFNPKTNPQHPYRARLVGYHPELEAEMVTFVGAPGQASPNRLDAAVWGHHELVIASPAGQSVSQAPRGGELPRITPAAMGVAAGGGPRAPIPGQHRR
jgi:Terminase large subunit, T4likevirus-type, N-terminal